MGEIVFECADCLEFVRKIGSKSVDLVLIDPPYEISRATNFCSGELKGDDTDRFRVSMEFGDWDNRSNDLFPIIQESFRILKSGGTFISFYDLWKIINLHELIAKANFKQIRFIEWLKTNPVPLNSKTNYLTNAREIAVLAVKGGKPTFNSEYDNGVYSYPICHDKGRFHLTQKSLALIEALILKHSKPNDVVVDLFAGSATTALAAHNTNRRFLGCEIDEKYYNKAVDRLLNSGVAKILKMEDQAAL